MNAQFLGRWDVAPRGHPNDGRLDVLDADLPLDERLQVRGAPARRHPRAPPGHRASVTSAPSRSSSNAPRRSASTASGWARPGASRSASSPTRCSASSDARSMRPVRSAARGGLDPRRVARRLPASGRCPTPRWAPTTWRCGRWPAPSTTWTCGSPEGGPRPSLPHVPGCDVAGVVGGRGRGGRPAGRWATRWWSTRRSPRSSAVVALGDDAPLGRGFQILGEQRWGGHADLVVVPSRQRGGPAAPAARWEECAAYPLATLTAWRMLRRARLRGGGAVPDRGHRRRGEHRGAAPGRADGGRGARHLAPARQAGGGPGAGRGGRLRLGRGLAGARPRWWWRAWARPPGSGRSRALVPGGRLVVCGGTSGQTVELNLPRLFFKQIEIIGSTMGGYGEFAAVTRLVEQGLPVAVDARAAALAEYPAALARLDAGDQLGKVVLTHRSVGCRGGPRRPARQRLQSRGGGPAPTPGRGLPPDPRPPRARTTRSTSPTTC